MREAPSTNSNLPSVMTKALPPASIQLPWTGAFDKMVPPALVRIQPVTAKFGVPKSGRSSRLPGAPAWSIRTSREASIVSCHVAFLTYQEDVSAPANLPDCNTATLRNSSSVQNRK
jgi:hypothetical protein